LILSKVFSHYNIFTFLKPESVQITDIRYLTMKQKQIRHAIGMIFLIHIICSAYCSAAESTPVAREFILLDQYGKHYEITYPQEKVCVLVFADKWGCTQVEGWVRPLYDQYEETIAILGVAQLDGVPSWLRSTLVRIFKKSIKFSVMMDWTGDVCRAYEYTGRKANVVIISRQGAIQHRVKGRASQELIEECCQVIDGLKPVMAPVVSPKDPTVDKNQSDAGQESSDYTPCQGNESKKYHNTEANLNDAHTAGP
jgi:hypothetical protein